MLGLFIRLVSKLFFFTGYVGLNSSFPEPLSKEEESSVLKLWPAATATPAQSS